VTKHYTQGLLEVDPEKRPSARGLLKDKFLSEKLPRDSTDTRKRKRKRISLADSSTQSPSSLLKECLNWAVTHGQTDLILALTEVGVQRTDSFQGHNMLQAFSTSEAENQRSILPAHLIGVSLYKVAKQGNVEAVKMLLNAGADVNAQGGHCGNALQIASRYGHEAVVRLLLDKGVDVNVLRGRWGNALQAASRYGHEVVVQLLLDKGADVNAQGVYYGNALQAASWYGHKVVVQLLLDKGADVNAQKRH
jgi:ankyrin repeat protein